MEDLPIGNTVPDPGILYVCLETYVGQLAVSRYTLGSQNAAVLGNGVPFAGRAAGRACRDAVRQAVGWLRG